MDTIHTFDPLLVKLDSFEGLDLIQALFLLLVFFLLEEEDQKEIFPTNTILSLRYSKSNDYIFNADAVRIDYNLDASGI